MRRFEQEAKYYQSRLCSCVAENNGSYDVADDCVQGFRYFAPVPAHLIRTTMKNNILNTPGGRIINIDALLIIPKFHKGIEQGVWTTVTHGDVISFSNKSRRETDILVRGTRDYIHAFDVDKILSVYSKTKKFIEGVDFETSTRALDFEDDMNILFEDGNSLMLDETRLVPGETMTINWMDGKGPDEEETYTVEFMCREQYRIWDDGGGNRGTTVDDLPKKMKAVIRRFVNPEKTVIDAISVEEKIF